MIKHVSLFVLLVAFATAIIAAQSKQQNQQEDLGRTGEHETPTMQAPAHESGEQIEGTIQKVDAIGNHVTIQTEDNRQETVPLDAGTRIQLDGKTATIADLKPGQKVTITLEGQKAVSVEASEAGMLMR